MTATALKLKSTPMAPYMDLMQRMTSEQKLAVIVFLAASMQQDAEREAAETVKRRKEDEKFINELLALRYEGEMSAEEKKRMLRESHYFGGRDIKSLYDGE